MECVMNEPLRSRERGNTHDLSTGLRTLDELVQAADRRGTHIPDDLRQIVAELHRLEVLMNVPLVDALTVLCELLPDVSAPAAFEFLTEDQETALRAAGSFVEDMPPADRRATTVTMARTRDLVKTALTVDQTAVLLGVTPDRIRRRLTQRTLLGIRVGPTYRLPTFQFTADRELPGWNRVAPVFPDTVHMTSIAYFMTTQHPDLTETGEPLSPTDWLRRGRDPDLVEHLIYVAFVHVT